MTPEERAKQIADHSTYGWLKNKKPIHKFNGGKGATLCNRCGVIIKEELTEDLYCKRCKALIALKNEGNNEI